MKKEETIVCCLRTTSTYVFVICTVSDVDQKRTAFQKNCRCCKQFKKVSIMQQIAREDVGTATNGIWELSIDCSTHLDAPYMLHML
jgi:hypothetical protein